MNAKTDIAANATAIRPIYDGMQWEQTRGKANLWRANSDTTPITYVVEEIDDGQWLHARVFRMLPGVRTSMSDFFCLHGYSYDRL